MTCSTDLARVCLADNYVGECQVWETGTGRYYISKCANNTICAAYGDYAGCYAPCSEAEAGDKYYRCDPDYTDEGFPIGYLTYQCSKIGNDYVYALIAESACGYSSGKGSGYFCEETGTSVTNYDIVCGN